MEPADPHGMQVPGEAADVDEQRDPGTLHTVPQQGIPKVPHAEHWPFEHVPPVEPHAVPLATQLPEKQHAPPEQLLVVGQHTSPAAPQ
jgi:hypothetical protein